MRAFPLIILLLIVIGILVIPFVALFSKTTRRKKVILWCVEGLLVGIMGLFAYAIYYTFYVAVPSSYAVWETGDLVIEYMDKHQGVWPKSWDDLANMRGQKTNGVYVGKTETSWEAGFRPITSIKELQQRVEIDWSANPKQLVKAEISAKGRPFRVIWLKNGKSYCYSGKEPNEMVLEYLKGKAEQKTSPDKTSPP